MTRLRPFLPLAGAALACLLVLTYAAACHARVPVRQTAVNLADAARDMSAAVRKVEQASFDFAQAAQLPAVTQADMKVQQAARAYFQQSDLAVEKVKAAATAAEQLAALAPLLAQAEAMLAAFSGGPAPPPGVSAALSQLSAKVAVVKGGRP